MIDPSEDPARGRRADGSKAERPSALPDASIFSFAPPNYKAAAQARPASASATATGYSTVFDALVSGEADIAGFVAYCLYKQNKRDWLVAFEREHHRRPTDGEVRSYIVGEGTERRLMIYRHLAEEILAERESEARRTAVVLPAPSAPLPLEPPPPPAPVSTPAAEPVAPSPPPRRPRGRPRPSVRRGASVWSILFYLAFVGLIVLAVVWFLRGGAFGHI
ncbi:MAG: hypothetical protein JO163_02530 [Methylobacteriaceae bacterium]|nr:hypothetical protein [Methylobacteriaceae bacterium]MBV9701582.1 hypothetical protein [Methylobacteriaceae bacterium]